MRASAQTVLKGLNPPQEEAVVHEGGALLVLAGAGSGKTRVLTHRVAWLIGARGVSPGSILAVTFTNKAAREMKDRIVSLVGEAGRNAWIGTFHAVGARILRREAERVGIGRDFSIFDRADSVAVVKRVLASMGISPKEHSPESLLSVISRAKNALQSPVEYEAAARGPFERLVGRVFVAYEQALRSQNALDFDDLLVLPVRLMDEEELRGRYAQLFAHVLVDEYQDTNRCQYEFLRRITKDHRRLFVVGDDDQSIYRWRGADLSNILDFEKDFPDARVIRLEQNYRSTRAILAAANALIRHNVGRKGKVLWTENPEGERLLVLEAPDEQVEALAVLEAVKRAIEEERRSPEEFVVLYRTNAQSRVLENTFKLGRLDYQVVGGPRFYERREVKDVLAYLRLLVNPDDDVALRRVLNVPPRGIGRKSLEDLEAVAREAGTGLVEAMRRVKAGEATPMRARLRARIAEFLEVLDTASARMRSVAVDEVTEEILQTIHYQEYLERISEREAPGRWENVGELLAAMQEFADAPGREDTSVRAFLEEISLTTDIDDYDEKAPRVTLMTLHNAKGLEFPCVFITGLEEGLFPHANSLHEREGLEEERRLFYVGLTRARQRVVLLHAATRRRWGGFEVCEPSRFLEEIDPDLVERRPVPAQESAGRDGPRGRGRGGVRRGVHRGVHRGVRRGVRSGPPARSAARPEFFPDYENENQDAGGVEAGMRVRHPSWGEGVIESVEGRGAGLKLTIRFAGGVRKKVLAAYAHLELLS